jgi:hypothetical protein
MRSVLVFREGGFATETRNRREYMLADKERILVRGVPELVFTFVRKWALDRCMVACPYGFVGDERDSMTANKQLY